MAGRLLLSLRAERKLLPATVINQVAKARAEEIEEQIEDTRDQWDEGQDFQDRADDIDDDADLYRA